MNQKNLGFSVVEILLVVIILGLAGTTGWLVYGRQKTEDKTNSTSAINVSQDTNPKKNTEQSVPYSFKELGVTMDILPGWKVNTNHTKQEGVNFYEWTVEKAEANTKILLSSDGFRGGFEGCQGTGDSLTPVTIKDTSPTQNPNFMYMSWSYTYSSDTTDLIRIVPTNETAFRATNDNSSTAIPNKDVKSGNYFMCISLPQAGFSLHLNNEVATGFSRVDGISVIPSNSSNTKYVPLPNNIQFLSDIKTMLTSLK